MMKTLVAVLLALGMVSAAFGHDTDERISTPNDFRVIARRIAGASSLLVDLQRTRATQDLHDRAHRFEEMVRGGGRVPPGTIQRDWRRVRDAFVDARRTVSRSDPRVDFLVSHLEEDVTAGERLVRDFGPGGAPGGGEGKYAFVRQEMCVGTKATRQACQGMRDSVSFRLPREVTVIRRILGEWRDFGRGVKAQVYLDGQLVWQTDVSKDWDTDARTVNVQVPRGARLTVRSSTGDPLWIRRFEIDY